MAEATYDMVQEYYGKVLGNSNDLKTDACCSMDSMPAHIRAIIKELEPAIVERFYGCGSPIPPVLEGCTVLDLGCGTGRDVYVCSKLVGPRGHVIGLDMTDEQIGEARSHQESQMGRFGFGDPNVSFVQGYMEDLAAAGIADNSVDVVISNCVINLSPDKERVLKEIVRVLKPGGELYFSDVFADRRLPADWRDDPVLLGECLGGALYLEDFRRILADSGIPDYRETTRRTLGIDDPAIEAKIGMATFYSITVRAFKAPSLEDRCEDYGQVARYLGTVDHMPHAFILDDHHIFATGKPMLVCGNTAAMLQETRFAPHFEIIGDRNTHFGLFDCGDGQSSGGDDSGACC
jgi:arsenite methyltransferase